MKKGISLIMLVITIIVIIILSGVVILSLSNNNPIEQAMKATYKSTFDSYNSELTLNIANKYATTTVVESNINASVWDGTDLNISNTVKEYIPSLRVEDKDDYIIKNGKLLYIGKDIKKAEWTETYAYINNGLILWLDGVNYTSSIWKDKSGLSNNAVANNFSNNTTSGFDGADAINFDGLDDNFKVSHNNSLNPTDTTMTVLVKADNWNAPVATNLIIKRNSVNSYFFFIYNGGGLTFDWVANRWVTGYNVPTNVWKELTITRDSSKRKLYVDGIFVSEISDPGPSITGTDDLYIGADTYQNRYYFDGKIRTILMYNRALTEDEIKYNYDVNKLRYSL